MSDSKSLSGSEGLAPVSEGWSRASWKIVLVVLFLALALVNLSPWWQLISEQEPRYVAFTRLFTVVLTPCLLVIASWRRSAALMFVSGFILCLLPCMLIYWIALRDAHSAIQALQTTQQSDDLLTAIGDALISPQIAWIADRQVITPGNLGSNFTIFDAMESIGFFGRAGLFATPVIGIAIAATAVRIDPFRSTQFLLRSWKIGLTALAVVCALIAYPAMMSASLMQSARAELSAGHTESALTQMRLAGNYDHRLDYDYEYRSTVGQLEVYLAEKDQPDYWLTIARMYQARGLSGQAYAVFEQHIHDVTSSPALRLAATKLLTTLGGAEYAQHRFSTALSRWEEAKSLDTSNLEVTFQTANLLTTMHRYREAVNWWRELIRMNESVGLFSSKYVLCRDYRKPITAEAWSRLSWVYYALGNLNAAAVCRYNATIEGPSKITDAPTVR